MEQGFCTGVPRSPNATAASDITRAGQAHIAGPHTAADAKHAHAAELDAHHHQHHHPQRSALSRSFISTFPLCCQRFSGFPLFCPHFFTPLSAICHFFVITLLYTLGNSVHQCSLPTSRYFRPNLFVFHASLQMLKACQMTCGQGDESGVRPPRTKQATPLAACHAACSPQEMLWYADLCASSPMVSDSTIGAHCVSAIGHTQLCGFQNVHFA